MINRSYLQFKGFLSTPPLWKGVLFNLQQFHFPGVKLPDHLIPEDELPDLKKTFVLGKRAESFFELAINLSNEYTGLAGGIQINQQGITLGEIDFLLEEKKTGRILHIELVYKYLLYDPAYQIEEERWIGPNRKDSLLKKIDRMREQQLPLLHLPETLRQLQKHGIQATGARQEVCFLGSLFLPKHLINIEIPLINRECIAGYWIHANAFTGSGYTESLFYTPKKPDWPIDPKDQKEWFTYEVIMELIVVFLAERRSPLVWMKTKEQNFERFFIVWW